MDILYEFDTVGIVYTAVVGGLFLLLLLPTFMFAAKRRQSGAGTVLYRVLDILMLVVLLAAWFVYVVGKAEPFGLSVKADGTALAFVSDAKTLFSIPYIGGICGIFDSVLGTVLLGLLSLVAVLSLILSFACRRKKKTDDAVTVTDAPQTEAAFVFDDVGETAAFTEKLAPAAESAEESAPVTAASSDEAPVAETAPVTEAAAPDTETAEPVAETAELVAEEAPPFVPFAPQAAFAAEAAADEAFVPPEKSDEVLVDVEVLNDEEEEEVLEPVEVLPEEPKYADAEEPRELSPDVREAIKTMVIDTPQAVKDALKVVLGEDAFIVKEVLRVIVETPAAETVEPFEPEAAVYETADTEPAETAIEAVVQEAAPAAAEKTEPAGTAAEVLFVVPEPAPAETETAEDELGTENKEQDGVGLIRISRQPAHKTYSSSLRRPDMKKKTTAAAAK